MLLEQQNATDATAQSIWDYYDHISSHVIDENAPSEGLSIADYSLTDLHLFYPFFFPVASTKLVDAGVLTNTTYTNDDKGVPIYWVGGSKVADDYEDFYDGSWDDEANVRDATGALITAPARVWTGSASDGTALMVNGVSHALGQPQAGYATPGSTVSGAGPLHSGSTAANTEEYPMYGLSTAFRIVALGQVSNLGQSGRSTDERSARRSQRFTTGAHLHGYENLGIQIAYRGAENRAGYSLSIYTVDTSGHPGTRVANLTYPDADSGQELTFDAPDNTVLDPNTTYAIVVTHNTATDEVTLSATTSDDEDDEGEDDWSISDAFDIESGGSWSADTDGRSLRIRVRATLKVGPPGKPTGLTANAVGRDRINLSWTAPSMDGGSAITGYLVESSADGSMGWTDLVAGTGSTTTSYSHTGLRPNTTLYYRVSAINVEGTSDASDTANATTDDYPAVTVSFGAATYTAAEGGTATVTVTLSADPERTVAIPVTKTNQGGATAADYSGVPASVTFNSGDTEQTFTFTAAQDTADDDGESVELGFGSSLPAGVSEGSPSETTVSIRDDDDPQVTVSFGASTYTAAEGGTATVTVTLSADPERTVEVRITTTNQGGASAADYSGVPATVTFNSGDTSKTITFSATQDTLDDDGESVLLGFGTLPGGITATTGEAATTTVRITDDDDPVKVSFDSATYTREVDENTGADQDVGSPVTASDTQSDALTYTLGGADAASFEIASTSGQIQTKAGVTYDHEAKSTYTVTVTASDGKGGTATAAVTITINDLDEPPLAPDQPIAVAVPRTYHQISVRWFPPENSGRPEITGYDVQYEDYDPEISGFVWLDGPQDVHGTSAIITNLFHSATYTVRVRAKNDEGDSPWSPGETSSTHFPPYEFELGDVRIPSGLGPGDSFRLLFVTRIVRSDDQGDFLATNDRIHDYTNLIIFPAGGSPYFPASFSLTLLPLVSIPHVDARVATNTTWTDSDRGVPIYWVGGSKVADDYADFYDGDWDDETNVRDSRGRLHTVPPVVWTGSAHDGTELMVNGVSHALGQPQAGYGTPGSNTPGVGPLQSGSTADSTVKQPLYGLTSVYRVVNPGLVSNLGQGGSTEDDRSARRSQRFTTGAHLHGYEISGIQVGYVYDRGRSFDFSISLHAVDTDGDPGAKVADFTYPDGDNERALTFETSDGLTLDPGTTYAVVVSPGTAGTDIKLRATTSNDEDDESEDGWSIEDAFDIESGSSWAADTAGGSLKIRIRGTLKVGPPAKPTGLSANAMGRDRINLSWTAPSMDGGSAITGYRIESSADGSTGWTDVLADTGTTTTSYSHTGLHANTTLYHRVSAINVEGTSDASDTANATTDDYPAVTVSFGAATYTAAEGSTATVTVTLSADPERTVEVPLTKTNQGGATASDYSGVPASVTFNSGDTEKTITFTATQDTDDDDGESVRLAFGTTLPAGVSEGSPSETTVSIRDDDDPQVTVSFGAATYRAIEGGTATVTVELSADPERTVAIPLTKANEGGASASDYSGVPASITFNSGQTSKTFTFTATADSLNESGERVKLSFGMLPTRVSEGTPAETTVTISDSTQAQTTLPTIHFGSASYTVSEGGSVDVTVTLSKAPGSEAVIPLTASNQGGATASDYSGVPTSVTFGAAETSKTFTVTAAQDTVDDDGESVLLGFGTLPGGITATTGQAAATTVSIRDDDDPQVTVSFGASTYTAAEGGTATVTVTLSADPERTVAIPVTKTNQGGATAADYSGVPASVTFNSGDTEQTFTFTAAQDTADDDGESVELGFGSSLPAGVSEGSPSETTVSIRDDDDPQVTVSFGAATYRAIEGSTATVTVELSADPERTVAIPLTKANEGGASASDYSGVPASITFNSGQTSKTFTFTATADSLNESGERVKLSFGMLPTRVSEGTPAETTVTISDSTQAQTTLPTIHFGSASYTVSEGGSVDVTVTLSKAPGSEAVIPLTASNQGGATASDYSGVPTSVTFGAAETSKTFTVTAAQDTVDDDGESVLLGFGTLPGGITATTGQAAATTVSIRDDDDPQVTVSFGASTYTAAEGGTATVTVTLSADPERTVAIPVTKTNQGGATAADYSGVPASVTFNSGDTEQTFTFTAAQDTADDDGESVELGFGSSLPAGVSEGSPSETTVSIRDDDDPQVTVSFGASTYTAAEGGTATVTVTLSADPERTVEVRITTTNQGGASAADYSGVPVSVTFDAGDTSKTFDFAATADTADDDGESVKLGFGSSLPAGVSEGSPSETTVSIRDDDDPQVTVSFGAATYTAAEGSTAAVKVELSADPERTVTVQITKTNQGGASAADYSGVPADMTFTAGQTSKTITFSATQDTVDDDDESVRLAFGTTLPAGVSEGSLSETTVSIRDDDDPQVTVSFGASTYTAAEGGTATVTVTLSADPERTVAIPVTKTDQGGATASDYSGVPASVTFDAGDTSKTITFSATQDTLDDDGESVKLGFGSSLPAGVSEGSPSGTTVSIRDDDDPQVTVSFGASTYTAAEGGTATVTVTLSADPERTVEVRITTTNQGGASAADYSGVPVSVTFDAGDTSKTFDFAATQDAEDDDGESVKLAFGALPTGVSASSPKETTVSITDDDDPGVTVSFGASTYTAAEGGTATVTVTLSADPERTVEVRITTTNQGGATAADYSGVPTSVTFDAGDTSKTFDFAATQDAEDDDGESVKLGFGSSLPAGVSEGSPSETTVSITDDDDPQVTVSFGAATYRAIEGSTAAVTVELSADPERTVTVPITTTNQGGATSADYSGVPATVTFNAGETSKTITFSATQDAVDDDGESVELGFGSSLPAGVTAGRPTRRR